MFIGYGTNHDAGIVAVESDGVPVFAASVERFGRVKTQNGSPIGLWHWLASFTGGRVGNWLIAPIESDVEFAYENGFYGLESGSGAVFRWTSSEATFRLKDPVKAKRLLLRFVSGNASGIAFAADVFADGKRLGLAHNSHPNNLLKIPAGVVTEITIRARHVKSFHPDPRDLGVMVAMLAFDVSGGEHVSHSASSAPTREQLKRLFVTAPAARKLAGHATHSWKFKFDELQWALSGPLNAEGSPSAPLVEAPVQFSGHYDHHQCHAATAYWPSGFDNALIVTIDGEGDFLAASVYTGIDGVLALQKNYHICEVPIGHEYEVVTAMLGFRPARHEGKITGLAAFGTDNPECRRALDAVFEKLYRKELDGLSIYDILWNGPTGHEVAVRLREEFLGDYTREDIAHAIQYRCEQTVTTLIREWRDKFAELKNIALAGGVFANVKLNQRIKELGFEQIFVQPAMSDAGLGFGAGLLEAAKKNKGKLTPYKLKDVFLGPGYSNDEIKSTIDLLQLEAEFIDEDRIGSFVAEQIQAGNVVAHFDGRMEFGPRALGNRSIMYRAADPKVNDWLNRRLNRTEFMPFAPAVMYEKADEYFIGLEGARHTAEFMTITCDVTDKAREEIPAAVHIDGTARPQLVHAERNPRFYSILNAYHQMTGIACLINTSFNIHEEPIVATPGDAIRSFQQGHLNTLIMGNWAIQGAPRDDSN